MAVAIGFSSLIFLLVFSYAKTHLPPRLQPYHPSAYTWEKIWKTTVNILLRILHLTPPIVIVVGLGISITYGLNLEGKGLLVLGKQPSGLPVPSFPPLNRINIVSRFV